MIDDKGDVFCDTCGLLLGVGDYPYCPHGRAHVNIERDEIPGGMLCENYGPTPIRFYSHSERRAYMKANGLHEKERFSPMPGSDKDPQGIPNPAGYMDETTLANAAELICRNGGKREEFDGVKSGLLRLHEPTTGPPTQEEERAYADRW